MICCTSAPAKYCSVPFTEQMFYLFTRHVQCKGYLSCRKLQLEDLSDIVSESDDNVESESTSSAKQTSTNTTTAFGYALRKEHFWFIF